MPQRSRSLLYPEFRNGEKPDQNDFRDLIDSFYSKEDDNFISLRGSSGTRTIYLNGAAGDVTLGGSGLDGDLYLRDTSNRTNIHLNGSAGDMRLGGDGQGGNLTLRTSTNVTTINLNGGSGFLTLGGSGEDGDLEILNSEGNRTIGLFGDSSAGPHALLEMYNSAGVQLVELDASNGNVTLGGNGQAGDLFIRNSNGDTNYHMRGSDAVLFLGRNQNGYISVRDASNNERISIRSEVGDIYLRNSNEDITVFMQGNADFFIGGAGQDGFLQLRNAAGNRTIQLQGSNGGAFKSVAGEWGGLSDKRLKQNIRPYKDGLEAIKKLNPVNFEFNGKGITKADGTTHIGFVAQDLQPIFPNMVTSIITASPQSSDVPDPESTGDKRILKGKKTHMIRAKEEEYLAVDGSCVKFMLINAVKELADRVEKLEANLGKKK